MIKALVSLFVIAVLIIVLGVDGFFGLVILGTVIAAILNIGKLK